MSVRPDGWQARFHAVIEAARGAEFRWGRHDCVTFAASIAEAVTGDPYVLRMAARYEWDGAAQALAIVAQGGGLEALATEFLGPAVPWGWCTAGDLVLALSEERELLAAHDGFQLIAVAERGLAALPLDAALKGWRL